MNSINRYIDLMLVDLYANKDWEKGYSLDVDSLPPHEIKNFIDELMKHDTAFKEMAMIEMQRLVDERCFSRERTDKEAGGFYWDEDKNTGLGNWERRRGF